MKKIRSLDISSLFFSHPQNSLPRSKTQNQKTIKKHPKKLIHQKTFKTHPCSSFSFFPTKTMHPLYAFFIALGVMIIIIITVVLCVIYLGNNYYVSYGDTVSFKTVGGYMGTTNGETVILSETSPIGLTMTQTAASIAGTNVLYGESFSLQTSNGRYLSSFLVGGMCLPFESSQETYWTLTKNTIQTGRMLWSYYYYNFNYYYSGNRNRNNNYMRDKTVKYTDTDLILTQGSGGECGIQYTVTINPTNKTMYLSPTHATGFTLVKQE